MFIRITIMSVSIIIIIIIMIIIIIIIRGCETSMARGLEPLSPLIPAHVGSSRMWCLRMWCLIIIGFTLAYTYSLPNMGSQNYYYKSPHP